jgi:monovalent cation:H+ antiporter-2, CPA2 family
VIAASAGNAVILIELGGVLLGLAILGRLAARVNLPSIPLYLLAGLAAGEGGIIPLEASEEFIAVGADVGVVLLLLLLGLEYSPQDLRTGLQSNWRGGLLDLVANMPVGIIVGLALGWSPLAALLLGGVTYISSSGIIARLLSDLERVGNRETPVILSILVIEDLAMAVFLPIVAVLLIGGSPGDAVVSVAVALTAVAVALAASARWGHHASRLIASRSNELLLLTLFGLTLLVAGLAEELQVSAAVGAFILGSACRARWPNAGASC